MITVRIFGGLGNQMFQYAAGRCLAKNKNTSLKLDISFYRSQKKRTFMLNKFSIPEDVAISDKKTIYNSKIARKLMSIFRFPKSFYRNYSTCFDEKIFSLPDNSYIDSP